MKDWISPIPKVIHLIWIGDKPVPDYIKLFIDSYFMVMQFQIKLWTQSNLTKSNFPKTYKYIQKAKSYHGKPLIKMTLILILTQFIIMVKIIILKIILNSHK